MIQLHGQIQPDVALCSVNNRNAPEYNPSTKKK